MKIPPPELEEAMEMSDADPLAAAKVLSIAAEYFRHGEALPFSLAYFLAEAIDSAMKKAPSVRGSELLLNLKLKAPNRRPAAVNFRAVGQDLEKLIEAKIPILEAAEIVAENFGISDSTVRRKYKDYLSWKAFELEEDREWAEIMREEDNHRDR
jgi:hypothetical protein